MHLCFFSILFCLIFLVNESKVHLKIEISNAYCLLLHVILFNFNFDLIFIYLYSVIVSAKKIVKKYDVPD